MIFLSAQQIRQAIDMDECIDLMQQAMVETSCGNVELPLRWGLPLPGNALMGMMPGYLSSPGCFGLKVVNIMPQNVGTPYSSHIGVMLLFDPKHGTPLAALDASEITAFRTAAASAMATRHLSREDTRTLTLIGTGEQAVSHLEAMRLVRDFRNFRVCSRNLDRAAEFAARHGAENDIEIEAYDDIGRAMEGADVVCTMTNADAPFLHGDMLSPGMHVNLVGASTPNKQEADTSVVLKSRYFVDYRPSAEAQAAELIKLMNSGSEAQQIIQGEIGEVVSGELKAREGDDDITVYRSLGVASQDLTVAWNLYEKAGGQDCKLMEL